MGAGLLEDLAADGVCTAGQAVRNRGYRAVRELVEKGLVTVWRVPYRPTAGSRRRIVIPVLRLSGKGIQAARAEGLRPWEPPPREVAHAIGVAELRSRLGIPARGFVHAGSMMPIWGRAQMDGLPDALYCTGCELIALEYDHGKYTTRHVAAKLKTAPLLSDRMVWGTPGRERARWLERHGAGEVVVLEVPLWP